jgi:small neutral amino acid transporter SnatA (MarC family)
MHLDIKEIFTAGMILFAVIDIIGNIPLVINLREKVGHIQSEKASIVSGVIMIAFLFVGEETKTHWDRHQLFRYSWFIYYLFFSP